MIRTTIALASILCCITWIPCHAIRGEEQAASEEVYLEVRCAATEVAHVKGAVEAAGGQVSRGPLRTLAPAPSTLRGDVIWGALRGELANLRTRGVSLTGIEFSPGVVILDLIGSRRDCLHLAARTLSEFSVLQPLVERGALVVSEGLVSEDQIGVRGRLYLTFQSPRPTETASRTYREDVGEFLRRIATASKVPGVSVSSTSTRHSLRVQSWEARLAPCSLGEVLWFLENVALNEVVHPFRLRVFSWRVPQPNALLGEEAHGSARLRVEGPAL